MKNRWFFLLLVVTLSSCLKQEEFLEEKLPLPGEAAKMRFNAGAAAYRMKDYEKAAQYFSQAALAEDAELRAQADFSFGNTLFRRGEGENRHCALRILEPLEPAACWRLCRWLQQRLEQRPAGEVESARRCRA